MGGGGGGGADSTSKPEAKDKGSCFGVSSSFLSDKALS